jgi:5-amino-6-(5-phosphoribosylamino)uracil reductase
VQRPVERPFMLLSCAISIDGYVDDASGSRLLLSSEADNDQVDEARANSDAILVGAGTVRADNPRLLVRSADRRAARTGRGLAADPLRVVLSTAGDLDPGASVFTAGDARTVVYVASGAAVAARARLGGVAEVADGGDPVDLCGVLADLTARGVARLMVEGGRSVLTQFLRLGLADELRLAVAPFFVGNSAAPRFVGDGAFPWHAGHPARLLGVSQVGGMAVLRYALSGRCEAG